MKLFVLLLLSCFITFCRGSRNSIWPKPLTRRKREVAGALHIVTNNAQAIHEDVKPENPEDTTKPCPEKSPPSVIEMGTVFQVTAPQEVLFKGKSLRKSLPSSSALELVRSISRAATLCALLICVGVEFYPALRHLYDIIAYVDQ